MPAPEFVYIIYIAVPAERVWNALVDADVTRCSPLRSSLAG